MSYVRGWMVDGSVGSTLYLRAQPGSHGGGWVGWVWCMDYGWVSVWV